MNSRTLHYARISCIDEKGNESAKDILIEIRDPKIINNHNNVFSLVFFSRKVYYINGELCNDPDQFDTLEYYKNKGKIKSRKRNK